ncbi:hypothetical protein BDF19DRAFT_436003 [Syncephalis fuscata]|nr:hypothetical protein BDF19DRAFT_436003 [Syncephalis fuscata]
MGRKHTQREALEALPLPSEHLCVARACGSRGQNLHDVTFANGQTGLCTLPPRFRNVIWVKRGHYVLVDTSQADQRDNKLTGEITHVLQSGQVRYIKQQGLWPAEFTNDEIETKAVVVSDNEDDEEESDKDNELFVNTNRRPRMDSSDEATSSEED